MDLQLQTLDVIEAPLETNEGVGLVLIALGTGILIGLAIT
jgi:hypothetical protein